MVNVPTFASSVSPLELKGLSTKFYQMCQMFTSVAWQLKISTVFHKYLEKKFNSGSYLLKQC